MRIGTAADRYLDVFYGLYAKANGYDPDGQWNTPADQYTTDLCALPRRDLSANIAKMKTVNKAAKRRQRPMTTDDLAKWKELAEKATEGPWACSSDGGTIDMKGAAFIICFRDAGHNGPFIAASRTAIPALIAEVERLRAHVRKLELEIENY